MVRAGDFRNGVTFVIDGEPCVVIDFQHVKPGKGAAFVRTKYKSLLTGATREKAFNPSEKFNKAQISITEMQYLYNDGELYYFMDIVTYDQIPVMKDVIDEAIDYLKESEIVNLRFYNEKCIGIDLPIFVELEVTYAEPGIKGDTASNVTKLCRTETDAEFQVPLFVKAGDKIKVDTRTAEYVTRI
jgi:elongation factor P